MQNGSFTIRVIHDFAWSVREDNFEKAQGHIAEEIHRTFPPRLQSQHLLLPSTGVRSRDSTNSITAMASTEDMKVVNIGTRRSQLAIAQVDMVVKHLQTFAPGPEYKSQVVSTMADENQVKSFQEFNAKSIWTEELEKLLMEKKLDVIVHCLKGRSNISDGPVRLIQS